MPRGFPLVALQVRLPADLLAWLDAQAKRKETDRSTVARDILVAAHTRAKRTTR